MTLVVRQQEMPGGAVLVAPHGCLDSASYLQFRDAIVGAATGQPTAVVVDLDGVEAPAPSAWSVLTSAHWHIASWPDVPLAVVASAPARRDELARNGITRHIACYPDLATALANTTDGSTRRRAVLHLPADPASSSSARAFVRRTLDEWRAPDYAGVAALVGTVLVEHSLRVGLEPLLRLELHDRLLRVSVGDDDTWLPVRSESEHGTAQFTGWGLLTTLCRGWGSMHDDAGGRVIWAVLGPENII